MTTSFELFFLSLIFHSLLITTGNTVTSAAPVTMNAAKAATSFSDALRGSLFGLFVGDSLAMPVHWYYNIGQLKRDFGEITKYEAPKYPFPGSIMNLSNTGGGGRGSDKGSIIGDVINHGKKKYWMKGGNYHYHHGMKAGENTLDAQIARLLTESIIAQKKFDRKSFLKSYITFMTTPGSHNDVYAGSAHRMFFENWVQKKPLDQCPDTDGHNIDAIDALINIGPIVASMASSVKSSAEIKPVAWSMMCSLRKPSNSVRAVVDNYVDLLYNVLAYRMSKDREIANQIKQQNVQNEESEEEQIEGAVDGDDGDHDDDGDDADEQKECDDEQEDEGLIFRSLILEAAENIGIKGHVMQQAKSNSDPMVACYIDSAYPAMLVYAYKYYYDFNTALLKSTNGVSFLYGLITLYDEVVCVVPRWRRECGSECVSWNIVWCILWI